ncbi:MAG: peptide-methionine (R)-S-oxide reductase MsrB [Snowella sp.]|nr:peptide-methionine (R)-S-oxide reductase MsrB [Snowella sp.]
MKRRYLLEAGSATLGTIWLTHYLSTTQNLMASTKETFEITKTDEEWRKLLTPEQYNVLRKHGTERSHTSPLDKQYGKGIYKCAGCDLPLFSSDTKFNSGTGWPSFYKPLDNAIATTVDRSFFMTRTEVHCRRCGGHLGHVFDDGPAPTGKRYCMNGVALQFIPS